MVRPLLFTPERLGRIMGMFEQNNVGIRVESPLSVLCRSLRDEGEEEPEDLQAGEWESEEDSEQEDSEQEESEQEESVEGEGAEQSADEGEEKDSSGDGRGEQAITVEGGGRRAQAGRAFDATAAPCAEQPMPPQRC